MTTRQISETIEDIYGFEVSEGMVSDITDKLLPRIEEWQNRPLSSVYPIVFIDAVHFSVRDDGVIRKLAAFPETEQQRFIVHMVRNTPKYVANKDMKSFAKDLKTIYTAADEEAARKQLKTVTEKWSGQYPSAMNR